jgi:RHS repeat-associated protein
MAHHNARGDVIATTASDRSLTSLRTYDGFGKPTTVAGTSPLRLAASSKEADTSTFLHEGFRERDIDTGLFLTPDPMEFVDGTNMYAYVKHNPFSSFDPYGLYSFDWGGFGAGLANVAMGALVGVAVGALLAAALPAMALAVVAVAAVTYAVGVAAKQGVEAVSGRGDWGTGAELSDYDRTMLGTEAVVTVAT